MPDMLDVDEFVTEQMVRWVRKSPLPSSRKLGRIGASRLELLSSTETTGTSNTVEEIMWINTTPHIAAARRPDHVKDVAHLAGLLRVTFGDDRQSDLSFDAIGIDESLVQPKMAAIADGGNGIVLTDTEGEPFPIDGATLRYLADPAYAAEIDRRVKDLHIPVEELDRYIDRRHGRS